MRWWAWSIIGVCVVVTIAVYSMCVMAGKTDEMNGCK